MKSNILCEINITRCYWPAVRRAFESLTKSLTTGCGSDRKWRELHLCQAGSSGTPRAVWNSGTPLHGTPLHGTPNQTDRKKKNRIFIYLFFSVQVMMFRPRALLSKFLVVLVLHLSII